MLKIAIGIATYGRPEILTLTAAKFADQTRKPDAFVFGYAREQDLPNFGEIPFETKAFKGNRGLCAQRNVIVDNLPDDIDILVFFDDDFVAAPNFLEEVEKAFLANPKLVSATGHVIADGINTSGINYEQAVKLVEEDYKTVDYSKLDAPVETDSAYGCNMVVNLKLMRKHNLYFDEALPEYGWQEDVDLTSRLQHAEEGGVILMLPQLRGVHMGHKGGRSKGVKLGYSQVANIFYIYKKGAFPTGRLYVLMIKNILANTGKLFFPEPWVDRKGRLWGNFLGIIDVLRGKADPRKISTM